MDDDIEIKEFLLEVYRASLDLWPGKLTPDVFINSITSVLDTFGEEEINAEDFIIQLGERLAEVLGPPAHS